MVRAKPDERISLRRWATIVCEANVLLYSHVPFLREHYRLLLGRIGRDRSVRLADIHRYMEDEKRYSGYRHMANGDTYLSDPERLDVQCNELYGVSATDLLNDVYDQWDPVNGPYRTSLLERLHIRLPRFMHQS
jgi:hypothetical protein